MNIRDLIYTKDFSQETKHALLNIVDSPDWVERLIDFIAEIDRYELGDCYNCPEKDDCEILEELDELRTTTIKKVTVGGIEVTCDGKAP